MADITLADYTGYIFLEIIRAREMADQYARQVAEAYAKDPVLQHFSVPRFKVPKMTLTIPVLISGARFSEVIRFKMPAEQFEASVMGRVQDVVNAVRQKGGGLFRVLPFTPVTPVAPVNPNNPLIPAKPSRAAPAAVRPDAAVLFAGEQASSTVTQLIGAFHEALRKNPDPSQPGSIVQEAWQRIFEQALTDKGLVELYKRHNPNDELFLQSLSEVLKVVRNNTSVDSTRIQSLLINPETNVVKNGSSDASVFTIGAELLEEGFFIRTVVDEATGESRPVVEFD